MWVEPTTFRITEPKAIKTIALTTEATDAYRLFTNVLGMILVQTRI